MKLTLVISFCIGLTSVSATETNYFVAPNGSSSNNGVSTNSPWPLQYALDHLGPAITVVVMPGVYTGPVHIYKKHGTALKPATVRSQYKWQAVIANSTNRGIEVWSGQYVVLDGLCVSNSFNAGIKIMDSHTIVRNCWLSHNGNSSGLTSLDASAPGSGNALIEYNLVEYGGSPSSRYGHGIYLGGSNNIVRGNVVRYNGGGFGIHMYVEGGSKINNDNQIYNNLTYGHTNAYGVTMWGADGISGERPGTNYLFGNTILDGVSIYYGGVGMSNNIILPSPIYPHPVYFSDSHPPGLMESDYNLSTLPITNVVISAAGPSDIVTNYIGFVNADAGLYWLKSDSPARSRAGPNSYGPVDFFGKAQVSVNDIGAFQYNETLVRPIMLDYWTALTK